MGSAIIVALLFLPPMFILGAVLVWFVPIWFKAPEAYVGPIRLAVGFLVLNLAVTSFAIVPQSVLTGENLAYKRMGLGTVLVFIGGGFTWLVLYLDLGIAAGAAAALASTLLTGAFYYVVARRYAPWFGARFPPLRDARPFIGLSFWFMVWNLVMTLMLSGDVMILGFFDCVEKAGDYTLTSTRRRRPS